jgi:RNA polymerase sigma-70 factor (ECF subfamily)
VWDEESDAYLTALALSAGRGDSRALTDFITATHRDVLRLTAHLASAQDAEDLTQETYLRVIGALHEFEGRSSARTWLLSIARRVVVDSIRRAQARPRPVTRSALAAHENAVGRATGDCATQVAIFDLLERLTTDRREALVLTQVLGFSYAEAAEILDCPVGTIRSRVARARADLVESCDPGTSVRRVRETS